MSQHPASMSELRVSVVIATHNRARLLPRLFAALEAQTLPRQAFEVILINDGSTDDTREVLEKLTENVAFNLRVLTQTPNAGPATARNRGIHEAHAEIVAFTDDDCVPTPGWLASGLALTGPKRIVVGRTDPAPNQPRGPFSRTIRMRDARFMQTCNVFYARADLLLANGFDERFRGSAAGEDTDLGLRVQDAGAEAIYCEGAKVFHDVSRSSFVRALKEAWTKWGDLPLVVKLHPQVRRNLPGRIFWKKSHFYTLIGLLGLGGMLLSSWAWTGLIPWCWHRIFQAPLAGSRWQRLAALPAAFLVDTTEVVALIRGTIRHRTLLL